MKGLFRTVLIVVVLLGTFALGYASARSNAASAQATVPSERAATIKTHLVEVIQAYHETLPADMMSATMGNNPGSYNRYMLARYYSGLLPLARDDVLLGLYLHYMAPVLEYGNFPPGALSITDPRKLLLDDSFLGHFAVGMTTYGVPPAVPNITDFTVQVLQSPGPWSLDRWPYHQAGALLFGTN